MGFWFWRRSWWVRAEVISWVSGSGEGVDGLELRFDLGFLVLEKELVG